MKKNLFFIASAIAAFLFVLFASCSVQATEVQPGWYRSQKVNSGSSAGDVSSTGWAIDCGSVATFYMYNESSMEWDGVQTVDTCSNVAISNNGWAILKRGLTLYFYRLNYETNTTWSSFQSFSSVYGILMAISDWGWAFCDDSFNFRTLKFRWDENTQQWTKSIFSSRYDGVAASLNWAFSGCLVRISCCDTEFSAEEFQQFFKSINDGQGWSEFQSLSCSGGYAHTVDLVEISGVGWATIDSSIWRYNDSLSQWTMVQNTGRAGSISEKGWAVLAGSGIAAFYKYNEATSHWSEHQTVAFEGTPYKSVRMSRDWALLAGTFYGLGCPIGSGYVSESSCRVCPAGQYSLLSAETNGTRICLDCPPNTYSDANTTKCHDCSSGLSCLQTTPWAGPNTGGTVVELGGAYFALEPLNNLQLRLVNGTNQWIMQYQVIDGRNAVNFTTSAVIGTGWVDIDVNTQGNWTVLSKFLFYVPPLPNQPTPKSGPISGGTILTITGSYLTSANQAWCRFEASGFPSKEVVAELPGDGTLQCTTPSWSGNTNSTVRITFNQQQYTLAGWFVYYIVTLSSDSPSWGAPDGQTQVTLSGSGFVNCGDPIKVKMLNTHIGGTLSETVSGNFYNGDILFGVPNLSGYSLTLPYEDKIRIYFAMNGQSDQYTSTFVLFSLYDNTYTISPSGVVPNCGPADGTTSVTISGSGYYNTGEIRVNAMTASGANITTPATYQSSTTLQAVLPASQNVGEAQVSVALNGQQFTISRPFTYYQVSSISPILGPMTGNIEVTVTGVGFVGTSDKIKCKFGSMTPVSPVSFTSTDIKCLSPLSSVNENVAVEVTANGVDYTNSGVASFQYYEIPTVTSVVPAGAYEIGGGIMTITGTSFLNSSSVAVAFIESSGTSLFTEMGVNPRFVSPSTIVCNIPSIAHRSGLSYPVTVYVEVRLNGESIGQSDSKKTMTYIESGDRKPTSLSPSYGPMSGGTTVTIIGTLLGVPTDSAICWFRDDSSLLDEKVNGTVLDDTSISCQSPNMSSLLVGSGNITHSVTVSISKKNDSSEFVGNLVYTYYSVPLSIQPRSGPVAGGTYSLLWNELQCLPVRIRLKVSGVIVATIQGQCNGTHQLIFDLPDLTSSLQGVSTLPAECSVELEVASQEYTSSGHVLKIYAVPTFSGISPSSGPSTGQTRVTITGSGFADTGDEFRARLAANSYSLSIPCEFKTVTQLEFETPSMQGLSLSFPVNFTVSIAPNGAQYFSIGRQLLVYDVPKLRLISPHSGPRTGKSQLAIQGTNFVDTGSIEVLFFSRNVDVSFNRPVLGTFVNESLISCQSPDFPLTGVILPFLVGIELALNGDESQTTMQNLTFTYFASVNDIKFSTSPVGGPYTGGTQITFNRMGEAFANTGESMVRFSAEGRVSSVVATFVSESTMTCTTPDFSVVWPGMDTSIATTVSIELSLNGQQYSKGPDFAVYGQPQIISVHPSSGPILGLTRFSVLVYPLNYTGGDELRVRFRYGQNSGVSNGCEAVSGTNISCVSPSMETIVPQTSGPFNVTVEMSLNKQQYAFSATLFVVYGEPTLSSTVPIRMPTTGNTSVVLNGAGMVDTHEIQVRLRCGSTTITAVMSGQYESVSRVSCIMPTVEFMISGVSLPTACTMEVALNGQQYSQSSRTFYVYSNPNPASILPHSGPSTATTDVFIDGSGFQDTGSELMIRVSHGNQSLDVAATFVNTTRVQATIPILPWSGLTFPVTAFISVSLNGQQFVGNVPFTFFASPSVTSISPIWDLPTGGSWVNVTGTGFVGTGEIVVVFIDASLAGGTTLESTAVQFVSSTQIRCIVPNHKSVAGGVVYPRPVTVKVRLNGRANSQSMSGPTFRYEEDCEMLGCDVRNGPLNGGTNITVQGANFAGGVTCRFAVGVHLVESSATVQSDTELICTSPDITAYANQSSLLTTSSFSIVKRKATDPVSFDYYVMPVISSITPDWSYPSGGGQLILLGSHMSNTGMLRCRLGSGNDVAGVYINDSAIQCTIPAHAASDDQPLSVPVFFSQNGQQWHPSDSALVQKFSYMPCRAGTSAKTYTDPCTDCVAGTYSPWKGQVACLECPLGYYCVVGSSEPTQCPSFSMSLKGATDKEKCLCMPGYYNKEKKGGLPCLACPPGAECKGSTERPHPLPGYWNSWAQADFDFYRCPAGNISCAGGANQTMECRTGYSGRMCSQCTNLFYKLEDICVKCPENAEYTIVLSAIVFLVLIYVLKRFGGMQGGGGSLSVSVAYIQITALFADFRLQWTEQIIDFLSRLTALNFSVDIASPECSLDDWGYAQRFGFTMLLPVIAFVVIVMWHGISVAHWAVVRCRERKLGVATQPSSKFVQWFTATTSPSESLSASINAMLMTLSLLYVILGSKALEPFDCTQLAGNKFSLDAFPEMECWTGEHLQIIPWAIACTVLYVVGIPVLFLSILFKNRHHVRDVEGSEFHRKAGVLFKKYQPQWYWWEAVIMGRKLLLVSIKLNLTNYPLIQGALGELVLLIALVLQFYARPFARRSLDRLEAALLTCNFIVLFAGMMFLSDKFDPPELKDAVTTITLIVLAASIVCVVLFLGYELLIAYRSFRIKSRSEKEYSDSKIWLFWKKHIPAQRLHLLRAWLHMHDTPMKREQMERAIQHVSDESTAPDIDASCEALMAVSYDSRRELESLIKYAIRAYDEPELQPFVEMLKWMKENSNISSGWLSEWYTQMRKKPANKIQVKRSRAATKALEAIELQSIETPKSVAQEVDQVSKSSRSDLDVESMSRMASVSDITPTLSQPDGSDSRASELQVPNDDESVQRQRSKTEYISDWGKFVPSKGKTEEHL